MRCISMRFRGLYIATVALDLQTPDADAGDA